MCFRGCARPPGGYNPGDGSSRGGGPRDRSVLVAEKQTTSGDGSPGPRLKLLVAGGALLLGVAYLVLTGLQTSTVYYLTVGELLDKGPGVYGQQVRVAGDVTPGSVR